MHKFHKTVLYSNSLTYYVKSPIIYFWELYSGGSSYHTLHLSLHFKLPLASQTNFKSYADDRVKAVE